MLRLPAIFWWKAEILGLEGAQRRDELDKSLDTVQHFKVKTVTLVNDCREANTA